jgi:hypothetical protein
MEIAVLRDLIFPKSRVANGRATCMLCGDDLSTNERKVLAPSNARSHIQTHHAVALEANHDEVTGMLRRAAQKVGEVLALKAGKLKESADITEHFKTYNREAAIEALALLMSRWNKPASCVEVPEVREFTASLRADFNDGKPLKRDDLDKAFGRLAAKARVKIAEALADPLTVPHFALLCDSATSGKLKILCILTRWVTRDMAVRSAPLAFAVSDEMSIDAHTQVGLLRSALELVPSYASRLLSACSDCGTEKTALRLFSEKLPEDSRLLQTSCLAHHLDLAFRHAFSPLAAKPPKALPADASEARRRKYLAKLAARAALLADDAIMQPLFDLTAPVHGAMRRIASKFMYASGVLAFQKAKAFLKVECNAINQAGATRWLSWAPVFKATHQAIVTGILPLIFEGEMAAKTYAGSDFPAFADAKDAYDTCMKHVSILAEVTALMSALRGTLDRLQGDSVDSAGAVFSLTCHLFDQVLCTNRADSPCVAMMKKRMREYLLKPPTSHQSKQQGLLLSLWQIFTDRISQNPNTGDWEAVPLPVPCFAPFGTKPDPPPAEGVREARGVVNDRNAYWDLRASCIRQRSAAIFLLAAFFSGQHYASIVDGLVSEHLVLAAYQHLIAKPEVPATSPVEVAAVAAPLLETTRPMGLPLAFSAPLRKPKPVAVDSQSLPNRLKTELALYRVARHDRFPPSPQQSTATMWQELGASGDFGLLHVLAVACFTLVPTSCAVERQIKENSLIHTPERNCLQIESLSAQLLVRFATTRGLFQPWRRAAPLMRKRKKLTAAAKNAKAARSADAAAPGAQLEETEKEAEGDETDDEEEALAAQAEMAALEEQVAQEAAENVADWNEQEGRDVLLQLVASVPGAPLEPLLLSAARDLPPTRRSARSTAGKDSRDRFQ